MPAIIRYPAKLLQGQTRDQIVTIMDRFSTVLELCGVKQEAGVPKLYSHSRVSVIADSKAASAHEVLHFAWAKNRAVRRGDWKLINQLDKKTRTMHLSLHNLAEPMPEVKDHAKKQQEILKKLIALHEGWEKDLESK